MKTKIEKQPSYTIDSLSFVRLKIPSLIPLHLIEEVKGRTFTPQQFYNYQEHQVNNLDNYLYALVDTEKKIRGFLWVEKNVLDGSLFVNTFSIEKSYWGKGESVSKVISFLKDLKERLKSPRVFWITTNEKFFIKRGFKKSKNCLMEFCDFT